MERLLALALFVCVSAPLLAQDEVLVGPPQVDGLYPTVVKVSFEGLNSYDPQGVLRTLGVEQGRPWPQQILYRQGVERVFKTYGIIMLQPTFTAAVGGTEVVLLVRELPVDLEPRFVGNAEVSEDLLREWAHLYDREQVYVHEADRVRSRLLQGYRRQGYHFAEIEVVVGREEGAVGAAADVIFEVHEGPKVRVTRVWVEGNESLPDTGWGLWRGGLRKLAEVKTKGVGLLSWWGGVFDEEVLEADLVAMAEAYRSRGWVDARVAVEPYEFSDDRSELRLTIVVDEGPLYRVRSVDIQAVERELDPVGGRWLEEDVALLFPEEDLRDDLRLTPGMALERARVLRDRSEIGRYYGERGYIPQDYFTDPSAGGWRWLEPLYVWDIETREVDVTYRFVQGRQRSIREVRFEGNLHTRDRVLRREVSALSGERANIRQIERGLARIRGTGYFADPMDATHPPPNVRLEAVDDDPEKVDVIYGVREGRVVNLNLSGGVTSDSGLLGLLSVSMKNFEAGNIPEGLWSGFGEIYRKEAFHGNGEVFLLDLAPGTQISYYKLYYKHPDIFGRHFDRWTASGELEDRLRRFRSHDEERQELAFSLGRLFGQGDMSLSFGPRWQEIELDDLEPASRTPGTLERSPASSDFMGFDLNLRYSQLDNRMSPRDGVYMSWANTVFGGPMGGDNNLWKSTYSFDYYRSIGSSQEGVRPGLYLGGELGVAAPFGDSEETHYAERQFYGGASSLRGFDFRGVGPNDGDFAVGGETFMRISGEYRYPLYSTPIPGTSERREMFRGFLFVDAGVLDPDSFTLDLGGHRAAVGFGFGLTSPIPLKFNFGFPIREGEGDDTEVFSFRMDFK